MNKPRVFVTRIVPEGGLALIRAACDADVWAEELPPVRPVLLEKVRGIDGLLCLLTDPIDAEVMDAAGPGLRVISNHAVGYDNVDVAAATARGIPVGNTPGILTETTADFAFALLMAAARRVAEGADYVRAGKWRTWGPMILLGYDVHGSTLGLVGMGRIGQAMARRAAGFGMKVIYYDPYFDAARGGAAGAEAMESPVSRRGTLDALLAEADFISLHVPLTVETRHLIGERELRAMKRTAILVNTARGGVVDQAALVRALEEGWIAGAGLDVMETEPLPADDPLLRPPNVVLLPHIGSASHATRERMASMAVDNCLAGLRRERLPHCANPQVYGR